MRNQRLLIMLFPILCLSEVLAQDSLVQFELDKIRQVAVAERDSLALLHKTWSGKLERADDSSLQMELKTKLREIDSAISANRENLLKQELGFVKAHPGSPVSLEILRTSIYSRPAMNYLPSFYALFKQLLPSIQNSEKGKQMQETLTLIRNSQVGAMAPAFTVNDINNEQLLLSSFQNKNFVLLDFWASWCVPCRQDFPFLKQAYRKYHSKGLEIISITTESDRQKWIAAIQKEDIGMWKHFSTIDNNHSIVSSYFVSAIPVKILIDKEGRIVARWRGGGEENKEELERTLKSIFEESF